MWDLFTNLTYTRGTGIFKRLLQKQKNWWVTFLSLHQTQMVGHCQELVRTLSTYLAKTTHTTPSSQPHPIFPTQQEFLQSSSTSHPVNSPGKDKHHTKMTHAPGEHTPAQLQPQQPNLITGNAERSLYLQPQQWSDMTASLTYQDKHLRMQHRDRALHFGVTAMLEDRMGVGIVTAEFTH